MAENNRVLKQQRERFSSHILFLAAQAFLFLFRKYLRIIFRDIVSIFLETLSKDFILIFLEKVRNYFCKRKICPIQVQPRKSWRIWFFLKLLLHVLFRRLFLSMKSISFQRISKSFKSYIFIEKTDQSVCENWVFFIGILGAYCTLH